MGHSIGAVLAYAVGAGTSPLPIMGIIVILFSRRAGVNGPVFVATWMLATTVLLVGVYLLARGSGAAGPGGAREGVGWLQVVLGVVLVVVGLRAGLRRSSREGAAEPPGWMARATEFSPTQTAGLALALAANPKNAVLVLGAATSLASVGADTGPVVVALVVFVLVSSAALLVAVLYKAVGGERADRRLEDAQQWLAVHQGAIISVLLLVFGAVLLSRGLDVL